MLKGKLKRKKFKNGELFVLCVIIPVLIQWIIFVPLSLVEGLLMPFQEYNRVMDTFSFLPFDRLFENFEKFFSRLTNTEGNIPLYILRGYLFSSCSIVISFISLFIAYAVSKKMPFTNVFTYIMLIPTALSTLILYRVVLNLATSALPTFLVEYTGDATYRYFDIFHNKGTALPACLFMTYFFSFPGSLLFYMGQFNKIPNELREYGYLEGMTYWQEFRYLGFPTVYPMWTLGQLGILTAGLTATGPGYSIYGGLGIYSDGKSDPFGVVTFGYWFQYLIQGSTIGHALAADVKAEYGYSSAITLTIALLNVIGIFIMKKVFEKKDPGMEF